MGLECPTSGFMGNWGKAEKWEKCTKLDFKGMYNYFIIKQRLNWCLSTSATPSTTPRPTRVDCQWSSWTARGSCSKSCGSGTQRYTRYKTVTERNGGSCPGSS